MNDFIKRLRILVQQSECKDITTSVHQELLLRDALVAGVSSDIIRARLLKLDDSKANPNDCIFLANAIELSTNHQPSVVTKGNQTATLAATGKSNHQTQGKVQAQGNTSRGKCQFCRSGFHSPRSCPARNDVCHKCGKSGHWQVVCRLQAAAVYGDEESIVASVLCAMPSKSNSFYASVCVNERSDMKALIDPGSTDSLIRANLAKEVDLNITRNSSTTLLADGKPVKFIGYARANS